MQLHCEYAWLGGEAAARNVRITISGGMITAVSADVAPDAEDTVVRGMVMPGLVNSHSHAFHRALRGRTHEGSGDFWAWRNPMYTLAQRLTPDNYRELSAAVYGEMVLAGITGVGEFHYVHHQLGGTPYANKNEMGLALVDGAEQAGIRLALLDAAYLHASLNEPEQLPEQRRFGDGSIGNWLERVNELAGGEHWTVGLAPHSVRAVHPHELREVASGRGSRVVHVHVSEQPVENEVCLGVTGRTPTQVLHDAGLLGPHFTAVHATHLTDKDVALFGASKSNICMCPTTERDLADGVGPASALAHGGCTLCLGSDSHAVIDLFEEARAVELNERLISGNRGIHTAASLLDAATRGGEVSLGWSSAAGSGVRPGARADLVAIDLDTVRLAGFEAHNAAAHIVHAAAPADVRDVWVGGEQVVRDRGHLRLADVAARLRTSIGALGTL
jgi:formiminoglutamate deiminase